MKKLKPFLTLDQQIEYLEKNKNIVFEDKKTAKRYLLDNNYFNVISSAKIFFCIGYKNNKHVYTDMNFRAWIYYHNMESLLAAEIISKIFDYEKVVNSRLAYYLSELINDSYILSMIDKNNIKNIINKTRYNDGGYDFNETWRYVTNFTFGDTVYMIKKLNRMQAAKMNKNLEYRGIKSRLDSIFSETIEIIEEIKNLRNNISHNTPLTIYLASNEATFLERTQVLLYFKEHIKDDNLKDFMDMLIERSQIYLENKTKKT